MDFLIDKKKFAKNAPWWPFRKLNWVKNRTMSSSRGFPLPAKFQSDPSNSF